LSLIDFSFKTKTPRITFKAPDDARFWKAVAIEVQKTVRKRTEQRGKDVNGTDFKPYTQTYASFRVSKGRRSFPNLSFTGKMLGGMIAIGRKGVAIVRLTGEQGFKAFQNEKKGREFFGIDDKQADEILKGVSKFIARKNGFK
jgi:hypothetical protein